jgi:hypothetical protein
VVRGEVRVDGGRHSRRHGRSTCVHDELSILLTNAFRWHISNAGPVACGRDKADLSFIVPLRIGVC